MLEKEKEITKPSTAVPATNQLTSAPLSRSHVREVPAGAVPITGNYEPSKLPEPNRTESRKELIRLDLDAVSVSSSKGGQKSGRAGSPSNSERYDDYSSSPLRRHDEEIRRNEAKKYAEQTEKINTLTKSIDTVNRENASLKHEITKLSNKVKKIDDLKSEVEQLRSILM